MNAAQLPLFDLAAVDEPPSTDPLDDLAEPPPPLPADDEERLEQLLAVVRGSRGRSCSCDRPLVGSDEADERRCWRCGYAPRLAPGDGGEA